MHALGVFHRDIKTENVMMDSDFEPTLIDFGLCDHQRLTKTKKGTLRYLAPELFYSEGPYDGAACDVFAFGVMIIELLLGDCYFLKANEFDPVYKPLIRMVMN